MVQLWMVQHLHYGMHRASFWIVCAVNQALNSSVHQRARTHGARFNCSKQLAAAKAVISNGLGGFTQRHDLGMGGGIRVREVRIPSAANYFIFADDDGPDGNFSGFKRALGGAQGFFHPEFIGC